MSAAAGGLSAVLITRDAEEHLERVLAPLDFCAEILILDSGSTDRTLSIARAHGARVVEHAFDGYGPQKQRAVALAAHDWILALDADEVLDRAAARAVGAIDLEMADPTTCWRLRRRPFVGPVEVRHTHWVPDRLARLFNRRHHTYSAGRVHASVEPTARVVDLPGSLEHYCYRDMADIFRMDYHRMKAQDYLLQGRRASGPVLAARAALVFLRSYFLRRGFLDGRLGVVIAVAGALNAVLGLALASEAEPSKPGERACD